MKSLIASRQEPVTIKHFSNIIDSYGQQHTTYTTRTAYMYLTKYTQTIESDIRYNDVVWIGITHDNSITDQDNVIYKDKEYKVSHTIEGIGPVKWHQVFLSIYEN